MDDDQGGIIFSQEAMRQHEDLVFPSYNFGSEPQFTQQARQSHCPLGDSQYEARIASIGKDFVAAAATGSTRAKAAARPATHRREPRGKVFSDPIHGTFRLDPIHVAVIDTPQFQRLRELHQLGLTHLVFAGATHKRFEHSLGTSFKAFEVADRIYRTQGRELDMELNDIRLVSLAGLCHDLGHGPFSHVFEHEFLRRKLLGAEPGKEEYVKLQEWHHETMSTRILEYLVDDNNIEGIEQEDIRRISDFIKGDVHEDRGFLFDIVNNKRCGVDVDKVDYLQRDAKACDVNIGCDFKRLLTLTKVLQNQIAYKWCEYSNIWDLFHARESMHRKVYTHRKTKAVEFMVVDALLEADQALKFSDSIYQPEDFCMLNDSLLNTIENFRLHRRLATPLDSDAETCMAKARAIMKRVRCRDLYRYGNQFVVPYEYLEDRRWEDMSREFTAEEVASVYAGDGVALRPEDVIVCKTKIDFTQGGRNPVDNVLFFENSDDDTGHHTDPYQVVGILPRYHQEVLLRVYTRQSDQRYQKAVSDALGEWCRRRFGSKAQMATPARGLERAAVSMPRETAMRSADPRWPAVRNLPDSSSTDGITNCNGGAASVGRARRGYADGVVNGGGPPPINGPLASEVGRSHGVGRSISGGGGPAAADVDGGDGCGTPTRSTPYCSATMARMESDAGPGTAGRGKRPRSSALLFNDV